MRLPLRRLVLLGPFPPLLYVALVSADPSVRLMAMVTFLVLAMLGILAWVLTHGQLGVPPGQAPGDPDPD